MKTMTEKQKKQNEMKWFIFPKIEMIFFHNFSKFFVALQNDKEYHENKEYLSNVSMKIKLSKNFE